MGGDAGWRNSSEKEENFSAPPLNFRVPRDGARLCLRGKPHCGRDVGLRFKRIDPSEQLFGARRSQHLACQRLKFSVQSRPL